MPKPGAFQELIRVNKGRGSPSLERSRLHVQSSDVACVTSKSATWAVLHEHVDRTDRQPHWKLGEVRSDESEWPKGTC